MLDHPLISGLITLAFLLVIGYITKLDMADITGLAKKAAKKGMQGVATQLDYQLIAPRTPDQQGGLQKTVQGIEIRVDADKSRIQIEFKRPLGMRLSSLSQNDFDLGGLQAVNFSLAALNDFFPLRALQPALHKQQNTVELLLLPLVEAFDNRQTKHLYIKDEYLRLAFAHRNYLPPELLIKALPILENAAKELAAMK